MITHTFCHLHQIGLKREQSLWEKGIHDWEALRQYLRSETPKRFSALGILEEEIEHSLISHQSGDLGFFAHKLPSHQSWRLFGDFQEQAVFLDIETNGSLVPLITAACLYDGKHIQTYVYGHNLDDLIKDLSSYRIIITYNGKCFDIPVIESFFRIKIHQAQIDLRYVLKRLGFSGGLKRCEKQLGITRDELEGIDGYFAVLLWNEYYHHGNQKALDTLLAYNIQDTVNLEKLMILAYNLNIQNIPALNLPPLPDPNDPRLPFQPDAATIKKLKSYF